MPDSDAIFTPRFAFESPYLADYFGVWMIHADVFVPMVQRMQGMNLHLHMASQDVRQSVADRDRKAYSLTGDGIARIDVRGPMMKAVPSMAEGTSTVRVRQQLRSALKDEDVKAVLLVMDTPGGSAKGNEDLANEVAAFVKEKPLFAFIEDLTASAGVSVASQATRRFANNATAIYGAMGSYAVLEDLSGMAEQLGVKVHVLKAGEFKGLGEPGTQVTDTQLAEVQRIVNRLNESYLQTIARGLNRSVDSILPLADGRAILAADAVTQGLIDGIQSYEQTYAQLVETVSRGARPIAARRTTQMAEKISASLAELKATFPNSTAEWRESQLEAGATIQDAAIAYAKFVEAKASAEREQHAKELEAAKNAVKETAKPMTAYANSLGHQPLTSANVVGDEHVTGNPVEDFNACVAAKLPKHRDVSFAERQAAIAFVARKHPELHRAYLEATNPKTQRMTRMIAEKYEVAATK